MLPLTGYTDRLSVSAGESIEFRISSAGNLPYRAQLVRVYCGDPNPDGPGIRETLLDSPFNREHPGREQPVPTGSYARIPDSSHFRALRSFSAAAIVWPTLPGDGDQAIIARYDTTSSAGFGLALTAAGTLCARVANGTGQRSAVVTSTPLRARHWYLVWMSYDAPRRQLATGQIALDPTFGIDDGAAVTLGVPAHASHDVACDLLIGAQSGDATGGRNPTSHFNGKIESPMVFSRAVDPARLLAFSKGGRRPPGLLCQWDFSRAISTPDVEDTGPNELHGSLTNLPTRAVRGWHWDGSTLCWRDRPAHYAAIHFHDDDIYDCRWETDFRYDVPACMDSGVYAVRLIRDDGAADMIPFFVRPRPDGARARMCVVIPSFTYIAYGNHQHSQVNDRYRERVNLWGAQPWNPTDHPEYGLSTYNLHHDGSGISTVSRLRPMMSMRSTYLSFMDEQGSGVRHFPADTHLLAWLKERGYEADILTDEDVHTEGSGLLEAYDVVLTGSHPEYHTKETLDAFETYTQRGGRLMYLGGNGFYWRIGVSQNYPGALEVRRAEGGIRTWAAEPGESFHALDGEYGGLWRRNGRAPQRLTGVGFSGQGAFEGAPYVRTRESTESGFDWVFAGVNEPRFGATGLCGGGAAGFEIDRFDPALGSPENAVVLASSRGMHPLGVDSAWGVVLEERLTNEKNISGETDEDLVRADMVYFERNNGGAVFSVGSITWCGCLPLNDFNSDVSKITANVLDRFLSGSSRTGAARIAKKPGSVQQS